jgi:hypothetical protein
MDTGMTQEWTWPLRVPQAGAAGEMTARNTAAQYDLFVRDTEGVSVDQVKKRPHAALWPARRAQEQKEASGYGVSIDWCAPNAKHGVE